MRVKPVLSNIEKRVTPTIQKKKGEIKMKEAPEPVKSKSTGATFPIKISREFHKATKRRAAIEGMTLQDWWIKQGEIALSKPAVYKEDGIEPFHWLPVE